MCIHHNLLWLPSRISCCVFSKLRRIWYEGCILICLLINPFTSLIQCKTWAWRLDTQDSGKMGFYKPEGLDVCLGLYVCVCLCVKTFLLFYLYLSLNHTSLKISVSTCASFLLLPLFPLPLSFSSPSLHRHMSSVNRVLSGFHQLVPLPAT